MFRCLMISRAQGRLLANSVLIFAFRDVYHITSFIADVKIIKLTNSELSAEEQLKCNELIGMCSLSRLKQPCCETSSDERMY